MAPRAGLLIALAGVAVLAGARAAERPAIVVVEHAGTVVAVGADGSRTRLAAGREPALSANGRRLAYARGGSVYVVRLPGGREQRAAAGRSPAWAPDGRLAVATRDGVRVAGRLVAPGASAPAWAPDGRLAVVTEAGISVAGRLVAAGGRSPAFAPDSRLAYVLGADVFVDGELAVAGARDPAWDPAGRLSVVTDAGVVADGTAVRGTRPGDAAPAWGPAVPPAPAPTADLLLPDLDQRAPRDLTVRRLGGRVRLGFTSMTDNVGRGPVWIRGTRGSTRTYAMRADQVVLVRPRGVRVFRDVGRIRFVNDPPHHHWHLMRFQRFELRRASDFGVVVRDRKTGFCLGDHYPWARSRVTRFSAPRFRGNCGQWQTRRTSVEMGTSPGYTDRYGAYFHGQSLDITGLRPGVYVLVHRANADGRIRELRYDNNAASVRIRIGRPRGPDRLPAVRVLRRCERSERC